MLNVVIFAAGRGTRLDACLPKFLVGVAGRPVFEHQLQAMRHLDAQVYIVCGFRAAVLCHLVLEDAPWRKNLTFIYNDDYEQSQVGSIRRALDVIPLSRRAIFVDGDMLFRPEAVEHLAAADDTRVVLRRTITADGVIAKVDTDRVVEFRREATGELEWGNLAVYQSDAAEELRLIVDSPEHVYHYELINELIRRGYCVRYDVSPLAEIDDGADIHGAELFMAEGDRSESPIES